MHLHGVKFLSGNHMQYNQWVNSGPGMIPPNAFPAGHDGETIYIGRADHQGSLTPGKVLATHGCCYIAWGGEEHRKTNYQILCGHHYRWVYVNNRYIPPNAFHGGRTENGETLFIGRAPYNGTLTVGKVQPSHGVCYISYGGQEIAISNYEILVT